MDVEKKELVSRFTLIQMVGCCGICISTNNHIYHPYNGKGLNKILNNFRINIAKELGYGILLCTDVDTNEPQRKTLKTNGWQDIFQFKNPRTNHLVNITIKQL